MSWRINYRKVDPQDYRQLVRDNRDMHAACQTYFVRCACGRLREPGIICPTNQEGGHCEAGS